MSSNMFTNARSILINGGVFNVAGRDSKISLESAIGVVDEIVKIGQWLTQINYPSVQADTFIKHAEGTGLWLLESPAFQKWLETARSSLWVTGMPGAGKTVLTSIVVHHLRVIHCISDAEVAVLFAYCNHLDEDFSLTNMLASFVKQLLQDHRSCLTAISTFHSFHNGRGTQPSSSDLFTLLTELCVQFLIVYVCIDALDEVDDETRREILSALALLPANVFLTSRPLGSPPPSTTANTTSMMMGSYNEGDIKLFISRNLEFIPRLKLLLEDDPVTKAKVIEYSVANCAGMFLIASLQVERLKRATTLQHLKSMLQPVPSGLEGTYTATWSRILTQSEPESELAKKIMVWLIFGNQVLTVSELKHALAISHSTPCFDQDRIPKKDLILSLCSGLVVVDEQTQVIRLVHYTAYQFCQTWALASQRSPHTSICVACLLYLTHFAFPKGIEDIPTLLGFLESQPFLWYSYHNWLAHARLREEEPGDKPDLISEIILGWTSYPWVDQYGRFELIAPSHIAAIAGLTGFIPLILQNVHQKTPQGWSVLSLAANHGQTAIVAALAAHDGLDWNVPNGEGDTPLSLACWKGHHETVDLLLRQPSVNCNSQNTEDATPLHLASLRRHLSTIQLLLARSDVDVNAVDVRGSTVFSFAAWRGHVDVVRLLICRKDLDINRTDSNGRTPLLIAAWLGYTNIVRLLLSRPDLDVNKSDHTGLTPLLIASWTGNEDAVNALLLHPRIDVNKRDRDGNTALICACRMGHPEIVKLFLSRIDVDVGLKDNAGKNSLFHASKERHLDILDILMDHYLQTA